MRNRPFTLVEMDIPVCSLTYGTAPCTASVPTTGAQKCFNTIRTCQDRENFTRSFVTLRICKASEDIPLEYDALPNLGTVNVTPCVIDPGNSIGVRANVKVTAYEHPSSDALMDKYTASRTYDPFTQGTFWARIRARVPSLQGIPLRVMRGQFGDPLTTYTVEHYVVESAVIDQAGISLSAKDALSYCDPVKAQCPVLSLGRVGSDLTVGDTGFTLVPSGIGDADYPLSGYGCLSGKEIVPYTRVADVVTIVRAGSFGSTIQEHDADSIFQVVQVFDDMSAADIVYSLLVDFTDGVQASWCDLPAWQAEAETYIGHLYRAVVPVPTAVKVLLDEMMQQAGCSLWWDPVAEQVKFQTLRPITPNSFIYDDNRIKAGSFIAQDQPDKRVSQAWTYYGLADATNKVDKEDNFRAAVAKIDTESSVDYDIPAYKKNLARWISVDNRPAAERLNAMQLARFRDAPRRAKMQLVADAEIVPDLGTGILVRDFSLQEADGSPSTVPFYVTSKDHDEATINLELEELHFAEAAVPDDSRAVYIDMSTWNLNLRDLYDNLYSSVPPGATVTFYMARDVLVGSVILGEFAMIVGLWPESPTLILEIGTADGGPFQGILGKGGDGGGYPGASSNGQNGSPALYTRYPITIRNHGTIGGGGGGGQGRTGPFTGPFGDNRFYAIGGGGGAGFGSGAGGQQGGTAGGFNTGGEPGNGPPGPGGRGGALGEGGRTNTNAVGHTTPGVAIDGFSYITFDIPGTILGTTIN